MRPGPGAGFIRGLFTRIAGGYDRLNRILTLGLDVIWRRRALAMADDGDAPASILDLASGTGDLALMELRRFPQARVTACDLVPAMLDIARSKFAAAGLSERVEVVEGDAQKLPFADNSFDFVSCAFGFRNFSSPALALDECFRVLAPGGRLVVLELFRSNGLAAAFTKAWLRLATVLFARGVKNEYRYLSASMAATSSEEEFAAAIEKAGLRVEKKHFFIPACHFLFARKYGTI